MTHPVCHVATLRRSCVRARGRKIGGRGVSADADGPRACGMGSASSRLAMNALALTPRRRIEVLLNTLEVERHARRSLLDELVDLTAKDPSFGRARAAALLLVHAIERPLDEAEFRRHLAAIAAELP